MHAVYIMIIINFFGFAAYFASVKIDLKDKEVGIRKKKLEIIEYNNLKKEKIKLSKIRNYYIDDDQTTRITDNDYSKVNQNTVYKI